MRMVGELAALDGELTAAAAEAASAFGDGEVFVEPYVVDGRHVEVQILADAHGTVWALGTRDCSLQRRHQKVIEEAPAPGLLRRAARHPARRRGPGGPRHRLPGRGHRRVPGLRRRPGVLPGDEHPPPGRTPGHRGRPRPRPGRPPAARRRGPRPWTPQAAASRSGHAVEARLYAEDPAAGWQPQTGTLHRLALPGGVRLDSGVTDGDTIGVHYDPMLAKVIAWAPDPRRGRPPARARPGAGPYPRPGHQPRPARPLPAPPGVRRPRTASTPASTTATSPN